MIDMISKDPLFGLTISILFFVLCQKLNKKIPIAILNPLLISSILIILFLIILDIPLENYQKGGSVIKMMISPVETIVIGVSLYKQKATLKKYFIPVILSVTIGCIFVVLFVIFLGKTLNVPIDVLNASIPKSITTAIAMEISQKMEWIVSITVMFVVLTGVFGAVIAPYCIKFGRIKNPVSKGLGIGTAAHAVGTSYAIKLGEIEGAMSGLTIGLHAIIASVVIPIICSILGII